MGKTRDLFNKTRDTRGTFHANMGLIKDRNGMDLTEAEDIKKRWQEYTELYKNNLYTSVSLLLSHIQGYHYVGEGVGGMIWENGIETA